MNKAVSFLSLMLLCVCLVSCSKTPEMTVEERVLLNAFSGFNIALVYNEVCNEADPKEMFNVKNPVSITLLGNQNILVARFGGTQHLRSPNKNVEELVQGLKRVADQIKLNAKQKLNSLGCDSVEGKDAAKAWGFYSRIQPWQLSPFLDKKIIESGGEVTSIEEIEAVTGSSVKK